MSINLTNGYVTYTPDPGYEGKDSYTYSVCDTGDPALCASATQVITVVSSTAPGLVFAGDDFTAGPSGLPLSGCVLLNDGDIDGEILNVVPQTVQNEKGSFEIDENGNFSFASAPGFFGPIQFIYTVCNSMGTCVNATIYLLVAPNDIQAVMDNFQDNEVNGLDGGIAGNVLENDLINGNPIKSSDVVVSVKDNGGMVGVTIDEKGNLFIPKGTPIGTYIITYSICDRYDPSNCDESMVVVDVFHGVTLRIIKETSVRIDWYEGDEVEFVLKIFNDGTADASDVIVKDVLPEGMRYVSSEVIGNAAQIQTSGQEITWQLASLGSGESVEIKVLVKLPSLTDGREKTLVNNSEVSSGQRELTPPDNSSSSSVRVKPFMIPNAITPNNDGENDAFVVNGLGKFVSNEIVIFNRWGDHVYQKKDYQNDWSANGLVDGTYYYLLIGVDEFGKRQEFRGWIQVITK